VCLQILHEVEQTFPDGRRRRRNIPLSEKLLPGESAYDAAARGITEELGDMAQGVTFGRELLATSKVAESESYPGLQCKVRKESVAQGGAPHFVFLLPNNFCCLSGVTDVTPISIIIVKVLYQLAMRSCSARHTLSVVNIRIIHCNLRGNEHRQHESLGQFMINAGLSNRSCSA
jgi:hypothetical protein